MMKVFHKQVWWSYLRLAGSVVAAIALLCLVILTFASIKALPKNLDLSAQLNKQRFVDRHGKMLNITYDNPWNLHDTLAYHEAPEFLRDALVFSEDKRFFRHHGVDWLARLSAVKQNLFSLRSRGASTITEQVVKMLHPRPRTVWTRWLEGIEARRLEQDFSKVEILEFYLNQVSFGARRRGVKQAAAYYFDRDLSTLSHQEMLALVVILRAPKWYDPRRYGKNLKARIRQLAQRMQQAGRLPLEELAVIEQQGFDLAQSELPVNAEHFIGFIKEQQSLFEQDKQGIIHTTLDSDLQLQVQRALDQQLQQLRQDHVQNGAALVVDHHNNEILAWAVGFAGRDDIPFNNINGVTVPRQPGSTLKPFLYAKAMELGWGAATMIADTPLEQSVGAGLHPYHNYSRRHYGMISLREALGNSLNIPAVRGIQFVGTQRLLKFLYQCGIEGLRAHPNVYGDGIALGNGEVSLFELVQAYTTLARMGDYQALSYLSDQSHSSPNRQVVSPHVASLLADILSDPAAREKEFGRDSVLNFNQQTAIKTGTSSDYRDAWTLAYNDRFTVGVWFGNLDYSAMNEITGSKGPALVVRTIFNELNRDREARPLYLSERLEKRRICMETGKPAHEACAARDEWFLPGRHIAQVKKRHEAIRIRRPSNGLRMAMDPRVPDEHEVFEFELSEHPGIQQVEWLINGKRVGNSRNGRFQWELRKGEFEAQAKVYLKGNQNPVLTPVVSYLVK